jgi:hypothetical protein
VAEAFQSYPVLVKGGDIPAALSRPSAFIDLTHRDARLALGLMNDGTLLIALTRFDALGSALGSVPAGLTVPEMSSLMAALGAEDAVALDGGISAQLMVQDAGERVAAGAVGALWGRAALGEGHSDEAAQLFERRLSITSSLSGASRRKRGRRSQSNGAFALPQR